jgi:aminocarboxymuconate-semialdehyde decarboxylase
MSAYMRGFFYDTIFYDRKMLAFLVDKVGAGRILLGTDYPLSMCEDDPVGFVRRTRALSREAKDRILWKNAARLYGLSV